MIDLSLLLTAIFFSIYGFCCAIEAGIALALFRSDDLTIKSAFTPFWEITNVFLVFGFTAMAVLFNNSLQAISHNLIPTLSVALFSLLIRACVVLYSFYIKPDSYSRLTAWLFIVTTFLTPLSFVAAGAYFLTGQVFYQTVRGWSLVVTAFLGLLASGLLYVVWKYRQGSQSKAGVAFSAWLLFVGSFTPLAFLHSSQYTYAANWILAVLCVLSVVGLVLQLAKMTTRTKLKLWPYAAFLSLTTPLLLAWSNRPYLIAGRLRLDQAFGAQSYASAVVVGMIVCLPIILLGFWWLFKLHAMPNRQN